MKAASPSGELPPGGDPGSGTFGKYRLVREVGRGGMGIVYEAMDTVLNRKVALKVVLPSDEGDPDRTREESERFMREARLSATLSKHPNVVGVYDAGIQDGRCYLVMEFVEGVPLSQWRRSPGASLRAEVGLLREITRGIEHAHRHGIIHRDLKPDNILVGAGKPPQVTDFGLAKSLDPGGDPALTGRGKIMGTPLYMSPEQAQGTSSIDPRTDVYSLGVMLYEAMTGRPPFTGKSALELLSKVVREPLPPFTPERSSGSESRKEPELEAICRKALAKDPKDRQASAEALGDDLEAWLRQSKAAAPAPAVRPEAKAPTAPPPAPTAPPAPPRKGRVGLRIAIALFFLAVVGLGAAYLLVPRVERNLAIARTLHWLGRDPEALKLLDGILAEHPGEFRALAERHSIEGTLLPSTQPPPAAPAPAPQPPATPPAPAPAPAETGVAKDRPELLRPIREGVASRKVADLLAAHPGPVAEGFSKALAPLLPEEQVHAVVEKLKEVNPKFLGRGKYRLESGKLIELVLLGVTITDLTPLAALPDLRYLELGADWDSAVGRFVKSPLSDLKPLRGLKLQRLKFPGTSVRDLAPLEGMPLETLRMDQTPVSDLSPLREMKKLAWLDIALTQVTDLSPLQGLLLLEHLSIAGTRVTDLSPLRDLPLKELYMRNLKATDYTPIRNCPLRILRFEFVADRDSALVRSLKSVTEKTLVDINEESPGDFIKRSVNAWDKVFDATTADRLELQPKDGWVLGKNGLTSKGKDCFLVTKDEFEDGDLRVRWHSDGLDYISIVARHSAEKGYAARPNPAQVNTPPGGKVQTHELIFSCKEDQVKAVLDGQPITLKDNNGPRRGPLEIHVSGAGHFVLLLIDRR